MALPGSAPYYLSRGGVAGPGSSIPGLNIHPSGANAIHAPAPVFRMPPNTNIQIPANVGISGGPGASFQVENPSPNPNFPHGMTMAAVPGQMQGGRGGGSVGDLPVKRKRGRPRKYGPDGANMSLGLSPLSASKAASSAVLSSGEKAKRGRPPGTGWKQKLAPLGEWMNSSAGLAFTPHVLNMETGEDIAAKILAFAQQRPRALCIMSGNGSVSSVTLRQPTNFGATITYEGRFEILCLSGSYLLDEAGGPRNRTGGISISICSPDGHIIGGAIGGRLIAANPVTIVACSFVYGSAKAKSKAESETKDEKYLMDQSTDKSPTQLAGPSQGYTPNSGTGIWPPASREFRSAQMDIDLMRG